MKAPLSASLPTPSPKRVPCISKKQQKTKKRVPKKPKRPKNIWTPSEDTLLLQLITLHGPAHWSLIASSMNGREGKQCRERWHNHLNPNILKDNWTDEEDLRLYLLYRLYGSKWSILSFLFSGRTDNSIKNHWNSIMKKKIKPFEQLVKSLLEFNCPEGLSPLNANLLARIRRGEIDNKGCRKGRTRNYVGFFAKNNLQEFVCQSNASELDEQDVHIKPHINPQGDYYTQPNIDPLFTLKEYDQLFSPRKNTSKNNHPNFPRLFSQTDLSQNPQVDYHPPLQMTPNSLCHKSSKQSPIETTANCRKTTSFLPVNDKITAFCTNGGFLGFEISMSHSPFINLGLQSIHSDSHGEFLKAEFRNLVTPTKGIFDFSNGKFSGSKSSFKHDCLLSNFKSLDVSKSLDYS